MLKKTPAKVVVTIGARIVGTFWLLGGVWVLLHAFPYQEQKGIAPILMGAFLVIVGALLIFLRAEKKDSERKK